MRHSIDNGSPQQFPHLQHKLKTRELQKDRANEIQLENRILLQKMLLIDSRHGSAGDMSEKRGPRSLHAGFQSRELDRITRENRDLLKRLEATSNGPTGVRKKMLQADQERMQLIGRINENSNSWRRDVNLRLPQRKDHGGIVGEDLLDKKIDEFKASYAAMEKHVFPDGVALLKQ